MIDGFVTLSSADASKQQLAPAEVATTGGARPAAQWGVRDAVVAVRRVHALYITSE